MKRRHSLSWRLILLFVSIAILIAITVRTGFRYGIQDELRSLAQPHLLEYIEHLRNQIGNPPDSASTSELADRLSLDIHVIGPGGDTWSTTDTLPNLADFTFHIHHTADNKTIEVGRSEHRLVVRLTQGEHIVLLYPQHLTYSLRLPLVILFTIFVVLALIATAYYLVNRLLHPIDAIREGIGRFGSGQLDHRIQVNRQDELGKLARSINIMADDIQQMLEAKRQLLLAISHELRSPLTRARVNAELLPASDQQSNIISDIREMENQLAELLETERLGNRHVKLDLRAVSPITLLAEVIEHHFSREVFTLCEEQADIYITLDPLRIRMLMRNLLENARRHTPDDAPLPVITSQLDETHWTFSVKDHGSGISPEHLPHLTEPFYRVDRARQRDTGGYGLGLYLCRVIAEAHNGHLDIKSELGRGTEVTVTLPIRT